MAALGGGGGPPPWHQQQSGMAPGGGGQYPPAPPGPPPPMMMMGSGGPIQQQAPRPPPPGLPSLTETLKCPYCKQIYLDPVQLDCSHSLCLRCARALAREGGPQQMLGALSCPACQQVVSIPGGEEASRMEDSLVASAMKRFSIHVPDNTRVRMEDLRNCYYAFLRNNLVAPRQEPTPTTVSLWRSSVARMECEAQEKLGQSVPMMVNGETVDEPVKLLRFKRNAVLQTLASTFNQQQQGPPPPGRPPQPPQGAPPSYSQYPPQGPPPMPPMHQSVPGRAGPPLVGSGAGGPPQMMHDRGGPPQPLRLDPNASRHLFIGNLAQDITEEELRSHFSPFGPLESVHLLRRGQNFVIGFVHFARVEDAQRARVTLQGTNLPGGSRNIKIQDQERGVGEKSRSIRVHNLATETTEPDLRDVFKKYGALRSVQINQQTHVAFVVFEDEQSAVRAYEQCHNMEVMGHHIYVDYAAGRHGNAPGGHGRGGPPGGGGGGGGGGSHGPPPSRGSGDLSMPVDVPEHKIRELVEVMQSNVPKGERMSLEDAMAINPELYGQIVSLVRSNAQDMDGLLRSLREELGGGSGGDSQRGPSYQQRGGQGPKGSPRGGPPSSRWGRSPPGWRDGGGGPPSASYGRDGEPSSRFGPGRGDDWRDDGRRSPPRGGRPPGPRDRDDRGGRYDDGGDRRGGRSRSRSRSRSPGGRGGRFPRSRGGPSPPVGSKRSRSGSRDGGRGGRRGGRSGRSPERKRWAGGGGGGGGGRHGGEPAQCNHLEEECDEFLQSVMGGGGTGGGPPPSSGPSYDYPSAGGSAPRASRWGTDAPGQAGYSQQPPASSQYPSSGSGGRLTTEQAASYACYEDVLRVVKGVLNPMYQQQIINRDTFKRLAESTTLWLVDRLRSDGQADRSYVAPEYNTMVQNYINSNLR